MVLMVIAMAMSAEKVLRVQPFLLGPWDAARSAESGVAPIPSPGDRAALHCGRSRYCLMRGC